VADSHVLIDIDGIEARLALAKPGLGLDASTIKTYQTKDFPTATDCVQRFAQESGIRLAGKRCAVSVSGAVHGDSIRIARCPWIISVRGFGYLFQSEVLVVNDTAAKLWAATDSKSITHKSLGAYGLPDFSKPGQWLGIDFAAGLGAALLVNSGDGAGAHVATEAGHMAFAPMGDAEKALAERIAVPGKPVSWEQALFAQADSSGPSALRTGSPSGAGHVSAAEILGSFVGDLLLATGAWDGVMLFGRAATLLENPDQLLAYKKRVETRANHQMKLRAAPQWSVKLNNINLVGAASYLNSRVTV
jgi:glucokinase